MAERLLWEDLTEGDEAISAARTVTETDVINFCGISGDFNWFHTDIEAAKASVFGERVAHGMLVTSIATGLQVEKMEPKIATAAFMGLNKWQFRGAVKFGDTIRVKRTIGEKTEHPKTDATGFVIYEGKLFTIESVQRLAQRLGLCSAGDAADFYGGPAQVECAVYPSATTTVSGEL